MAKENLYKHESGFEKHDDEGNELPSKPSGLIDAILSNTILANPAQKASPSDTNGKISGIVVGRIVDAEEQTVPKVDFPINASGAPVPALSTVPVEAKDKGREVALGFINGDSRTPIILGFMHHASATAASHVENSKAITVEKDGETVTISADKEIVLKCGEGSIQITKDGKITIRGTNLVSRASKVNKIRGAAVQIN
jgi:hypothetical protein